MPISKIFKNLIFHKINGKRYQNLIYPLLSCFSQIKIKNCKLIFLGELPPLPPILFLCKIRKNENYWQFSKIRFLTRIVAKARSQNHHRNKIQGTQINMKKKNSKRVGAETNLKQFAEMVGNFQKIIVENSIFPKKKVRTPVSP